MKRILPLCVLALALALIAAPAFAAAPSADLQKHAAANAEVLIGVNVPAVRQSFLFQDLIGFIRSQPANQDVLGFVLSGGFIDIEKDVDGLLIASPATALPSQPGQPLPKQDVSLLVRGKIDTEKAIAAAKSNYPALETTKVGKLDVWSTGSFEFAFPNDSTMVLVSAEEGFRQATWAAVNDSKKSVSASKEMQGVLKRIKTSSGIWMASTSPPSAGASMPNAPVKNMALSMDIAGRLRIDMKSQTTNEEGAKMMAEQLEGLKTSSAQSGMVQAFGAGPLLANLDITQKGDRVDLSTRMTEREFKTMFERVKALAASNGPMAAPANPTKPSPGATPAPSGTTSGADADFN